MSHPRKRHRDRSGIRASRSAVLNTYGAGAAVLERSSNKRLIGPSAIPQAPAESASMGSMRWAATAAMTAAFVWSYWPVLVELWAAWERVPDYSHGYLVAPVALL